MHYLKQVLFQTEVKVTHITRCAACNQEMETSNWFEHQCTNPDSKATGTITCQDRLFGLVKQVQRYHAVPPILSCGRGQRFSQWCEYHGPKSKLLLMVAMLLFGKRPSGGYGLVHANSHEWTFFDFRRGLYGFPEDWTTTQ